LDTHSPRKAFLTDLVQRPGPFWFNALGPTLARTRWSRLGAECGLNPSNYGTARLIDKTPSAQRQTAGKLSTSSQAHAWIEILPQRLKEQYCIQGLDFYEATEIDSHLLENLTDALQAISHVSGAAVAVSSVLTALHLLRPQSIEYDVSYSDPSVPFSIFVGVTTADHAFGELRLAEGILHECMHLQLTLLEEELPLIANESDTHLSPWRQTLRPTRGLLHGLYVFRVIQDFFTDPSLLTSLTVKERRYVAQRVDQIDGEIANAGNFSNSADLTAVGRTLAERLQRGN
jgi:hypothetical protein